MEIDRFKAIYLIGLLPLAAIRTYYTLLTRHARVAADRRTPSEVALMLLAAVGMLVIPFLFVFTPWLDFADYDLPGWTAWLAATVLAAGITVLRLSHAALQANFSSTLQLREHHALIANGIYRTVRHPMYASLWLLGVANALLFHNWIAGWSYLVGFGLLYFVRVPREERMMMERFGDEYREYMNRTGRLLPKLQA